MRSCIFTAILLLLFPGICPADTRSACRECVIEANGPAALSKEVILRALPPLPEIAKLCPGAQKESTMFLSPYSVDAEDFYYLQLSFLFGDDTETIIALTTLYTSYFIYAEQPGEPGLMATYLAMRNASWASQLENSFSRAPADKVFAASAGRYFMLLRATPYGNSASCLQAARELFHQHLRSAAEQIGPEEPAGGPLKGLVYAQGALLDAQRTLTEEELAALSAYRRTLYSVAAAKGLSEAGSAQIADFPNLEQVSLGPTPLSARDLAALGTLSKLRILKLGSCGITDPMLPPLGKLAAVESLSLRRNQISNEGIKALVPLKTLRHLALGDTGISDPALESISQMPALRRLFLHNTAITDKGIEKLQTLKNLRYLTLNGTQVTDASIEALAKLPALKDIVLSRSRVTAEGRQRLKELSGGRIRVQ